MRSSPIVQPQIKTKKRKRALRLARLFLVAAIVCYGLYCLEARIRPVLFSIIEYESKRYAMAAFNDAVAEVIEVDPDAYRNLFEISYDADGNITSVQSNTYTMNLLSSKLTQSAETHMKSFEKAEYQVPIGSLLGMQTLSGRGPKLSMKILPETYLMTNVYDTFEDAGINQTKLCVYVHFKMEMSVILSGYTQNITAENDICLTQIMIVGDIPQSYWHSGSV